jgi:tRNA(fMet)-specific endonuclease VapC
VKYLLDTNILNAVASKKNAAVVNQFKAVQRQELATCDVVLHEVRFGLATNSIIAFKLGSIYEALFDSLNILPTDQTVWLRAATIRTRLKQRGSPTSTPIGPYDLLIAATAMQHNLVLVTSNKREFDDVEGLQVEDWSSEGLP